MKRLVVLLPLLGCVSDPETGKPKLNLTAIHTELTLVDGDLRDAAALLKNEDPERSAEIAAFADALLEVDAAVQAAILEGTTADLAEVARLALEAAEPFLEGSNEDVRLAAFMARAILRRIETYGSQ
jgi:hypothetical protein